MSRAFLFERLASGIFTPKDPTKPPEGIREIALEIDRARKRGEQTYLSLRDQAAMEEILHGLTDVYVRRGEEVKDARRARAAFDLAHEAMRLLDRFFDDYTDRKGNVTTLECLLLSKLAEISLGVGLTWYQENKYMVTPEQWEALGRPAAVGIDGKPLRKLDN